MKKKLRSHDWFGRKDKDGIIYRSWMKNQGMPNDMFDGRPVIGICNTFSELTPCNAHFRDHAEAVKKGVLEAGGFPVEFPIMSLGETLLKPTAMLFRNLASMDAEESIRGILSTVLYCSPAAIKQPPPPLWARQAWAYPPLWCQAAPCSTAGIKARPSGAEPMFGSLMKT